MAKCTFLAMTAGEFEQSPDPESRSAWMACQFSPWNQGLSNLPQALPEGSLVILNDQSPICGHDSSRILRQLKALLEGNRCYGLLLDFERPGQEEAAAMAAALVEALSCPVGVSAAYAGGLSSPVFVPPAPPDTPLSEYLAPWAGREIWLEAALNGCRITLTEQGASIQPLDAGEHPAQGFRDAQLHCSYRIARTDSDAQFTLWRSREDLWELLDEAASLGVTATIGLYQELGDPL